jgi:hypothetical protein
MMGPRQVDQAALFYEFSLERHVPATHLLRAISQVRGHYLAASRGGSARIPDLVRRSGIDLEVITQRSQKTHELLELSLGESSSQDFRQLGLGGSNPPRGDARWPRDDWPTKYAHCRGLPTGVFLSQTAIARIVRRRRELLPVRGLPIAMEEPPCPSPRPCKSTWIRPSHTK